MLLSADVSLRDAAVNVHNGARLAGDRDLRM
jgi:hypothetical protein